MCWQEPRGFQPMRCGEPHGIFWKATAFPKLNIFIPPPQMARRLAVFQRQACVFNFMTFMLSTENTWNCRQSFQESRDGDFFPSIKFPSTFRQSFSCLCTAPLLSQEPGDLSPWLDRWSARGLCACRCCGPRSVFGTCSACRDTAWSLAEASWPEMGNPCNVYTYLTI